jgi:hypothetical protein
MTKEPGTIIKYDPSFISIDHTEAREKRDFDRGLDHKRSKEKFDSNDRPKHDSASDRGGKGVK